MNLPRPRTGKRVIYFTVGGREEQAEFNDDDSTEEVKELFQVAAEARPCDILKLYSRDGNLVNISHKLQPNTPDTRYDLQVVASYFNNRACSSSCRQYQEPASQDSVTSDDTLSESDRIAELENRIQKLEHNILVESHRTPSLVEKMKEKVEECKIKLENVDHLSWLGLYKDISCGTTSMQLFWNKHNTSGRFTAEHNNRVHAKFMQMSDISVTDEVREYLRKPTFDNWQWDEAEMLILIRQMYIDLNLISALKLEIPVLHTWLFEVYRNYNFVPFHNFNHCFMVTQMMYGLIWLIDLKKMLDDVDIFILLTAAICHDLDHPGYNNAYQVNARTELALRYNDISPLENHHCSVAFEILEKPNANILRNVTAAQFKRIREGMIKCILATDMSKHSEILYQFKGFTPAFDFDNKEHKSVLMMILIKVADISNEVRPLSVAGPWVDCLLQEFFNQSDVEKLEGLPVAPFMDREKVTKPSSQVGFIKFVLLPLFEALGDLFPIITDDIIWPVRKALHYYTDMQQAMDEKNFRSTSESRCTAEVNSSGGSSTATNGDATVTSPKPSSGCGAQSDGADKTSDATVTNKTSCPNEQPTKNSTHELQHAKDVKEPSNAKAGNTHANPKSLNSPSSPKAAFNNSNPKAVNKLPSSKPQLCKPYALIPHKVYNEHTHGRASAPDTGVLKSHNCNSHNPSTSRGMDSAGHNSHNSSDSMKSDNSASHNASPRTKPFLKNALRRK